MESNRKRSFTAELLLVGLAALAARFVYLLVVERQGLFFGLFLDSRHYATQAELIRTGHGIGDHPYLFSPAYPYFLALFTNGIGELSVVWVQRCQALFGVGTAVLTALVGRRLGGRAVGLIAGFVVALYGPFIHLDSMVLVASLQTFFFTLALWLVIGAAKSLPRWFGAGLALGVSVALRPTGLAIAIVVAVVLLIGRRWKPVTGFLLGLALVVTPFTVRNVASTGEWVLLSANGGINFWVGNHAGAIGLYRLPPGTDFINDPLSKRNAEISAGRSLSYKEASRWWYARTIRDIRRAPVRWGRLLVRKAIYFLHPAEISQLGSGFHWYRERAWPLRLPVDARWIFILAAGAFFFREKLDRESLLWTVCFLLVYAAGICLFFVTGRHRSPLMPAAIVLAASTVVGIGRAFRSRKSRQRPALVALPLVTIVALWAVSYALYSPGAPFFVSENTGLEERHRGMALFDAGRYDEAAEAFRNSLAITDDPVTRNNLANSLTAAGRIAEATEQYEESLRRNPSAPLTWYNYGILLSRSREKTNEAERAFRQAARLGPLMPEPHLKLGELLLASGRSGEAIVELERCLELAPPGAPVGSRAEYLLARARESSSAPDGKAGTGR